MSHETYVVACSQSGTGVKDDLPARLELLLNAYEYRIFNFLLSVGRDREVARDALQQTFLLALEQLQKGRMVNAAWMYKVARSKLVDEFRHRQRFATNSEELQSTEAPEEHTGETATVQRILSQLPTAERELLYLYDVDGFSSEQIGAMLRARPGTVRMRALRARDHFRTLLEQERSQL